MQMFSSVFVEMFALRLICGPDFKEVCAMGRRWKCFELAALVHRVCHLSEIRFRIVLKFMFLFSIGKVLCSLCQTRNVVI